jgi:eukaryotic-like serine/threonine-protein kinase
VPITEGTRLGPYEIVDLLGAGGMGEVWRARDTRLGREVAVKVLPDEFVDDAERAARFQREAQLLAAFNHPNIAGIYSFEQAAGIRLLVMELVPGETVKEILARGPIPVPRALVIARDVADALDAAHAKGILHRDLKPANVKVTSEGKVKLLDFGLAKAFAGGVAAVDISESPTLGTDTTKQGMVLGTASYMSPEQTRGRTLDRRSDVWAFGCLLYEMLTGKKAFTGDTVSDVLVAILDREPDWDALPPDVPRAVAELLKSCLTKRLDERLPDLAHARQQLDLVRMGRTTLIPAAGASASRPRRRPLPVAAGAAAVLLVVAAVVWVAFRERSSKALPATKLLAVLPAADFTGRPDGRALADGISMSLRQRLQPVTGVSITMPSSAEAARETDPAKVARDQGANLLVVPSVQRSGDRLRLSYSLRLDSSPIQIDAGDVDGPESDLFALQDALAAKLVASLQLRFAGGGTPPREEIPKGPSQSDYVTALGYLERYDDLEKVQKAVDLLTGIPGGGMSALVQSALGRAYLASYTLSKDVAFAAKAKDAAESAVALDPGLPDALVTLGQVLTATGKYAESIEAIRKALVEQPGNAEAVFALAYALELSGNLAEAEKSYLEGARLRPTWWASFNKLGGFYFLAKSDYPKAADAFNKAIGLNPEVARPHYNLGAVYLRNGAYPEAETEFRRSLAIKPTAPAWSNLGTSLFLLGRYPEAADAFEKAVALAPKNFLWSAYWGDALAAIPGRDADARKAYGTALALGDEQLRVNPADARTRAIVARCLARLGQKERAWLELQQAVRAAATDPNVLLPAAGTAALLDRRAEALRWLETAVDRGVGTGEITNNPEFSGLRGDPAFQALLKRPVHGPAKTP